MLFELGVSRQMLCCCQLPYLAPEVVLLRPRRSAGHPTGVERRQRQQHLTVVKVRRTQRHDTP